MADGKLHFGAYTDAGVEIGAGITMTRDGKLVADISQATGISAGVWVGIAPPGSPTANQLWWKSDDGILFVYYNDGNTTQWVPASPSAPILPPGVVLQTIDATSGVFQNVPGGVVPWNQTTAMTSVQGQQIYSAVVTPKSAASRLLVEVLINFSSPTQDSYTLGLFRDAGANAIAQGLCAHSVAASAFQLSLRAVIPSVATTATTLKLRMGGNGGPAFVINGVSGGSAAVGGGTMFSGMTITEVQ
jgi:hypothetical protein